jgi:glycosyltransferase involved in cell wall biosynthesis
MNIILITTQFPFPLNEGANIRTFNLIKQLSLSYNVTLVTFVKYPNDMDYIPNLIPYCNNIVTVKLFRSRLKIIVDKFLYLFSMNPHIVNINRSSEMREIVINLSQNADAVQAEFSYAGQYILGLSCRKVLDAHNIESDILKTQYLFENNIIKKIYYGTQYIKMLHYEKTIFKNMDIILATSEEDRNKLSKYNDKAYVIQNGVEDSIDIINDIDNNIVTFTGLMSYRANIDAMIYYYNEILPLIKREEPYVKTFIVGKNPTKEIISLSSKDIIVTGKVNDIKRYINNTSVFIVPLRIGSGTRIKILEAMAFGKPVVTTSLGCMGIEVSDGENILIADEPKDFARHVINLLRNKSERTRIGSNALRLINEKYKWDIIGNKLNSVYNNEN